MWLGKIVSSHTDFIFIFLRTYCRCTLKSESILTIASIKWYNYWSKKKFKVMTLEKVEGEILKGMDNV